MKITGVTPLFIDRFLFVRVTTDKGISGVGESGAWGHLEASGEHGGPDGGAAPGAEQCGTRVPRRVQGLGGANRRRGEARAKGTKPDPYPVEHATARLLQHRLGDVASIEAGDEARHARGQGIRLTAVHGSSPLFPRCSRWCAGL